MKKAKIGVVGLGGRGTFFCQMLRETPSTELVAVCDKAARRLESFACESRKIRLFTDLKEMVKMEGLDGVIVATNDPDHTQPALITLKAGKHCLVEKPLAQTVDDCEEILKAAEMSGATLMVGFELRYCSMFQKMRELIDKGVIGDIKMGWAIDNVSVGGMAFFHSKCGTKAFIKSLSLQKGCHTIDLLNWFMDGHPVSIYASGGLNFFGGTEPTDKRCRNCERARTCPEYLELQTKERCGISFTNDDLCAFGSHINVDDNILSIIQYDNGRRAFYAECHFTPEYTREFTFIGDKGKMVGQYTNEKFFIQVIHRYSGKTETYEVPPNTEGGHGGGDKRILKEFVSCCIGACKHPLADGTAGYDSTFVAEYIQKSIETGQIIFKKNAVSQKQAEERER